jgi:hypothetical protein
LALVVKHQFESAKGDGEDPTRIQPSHWNADHTVEGAGALAEKNIVTTEELQDNAVTTSKLASAVLRALAVLTGAANKLAYFTSASAAALTDLSAFGRSLIDDADAAAARATLNAEQVGVYAGIDTKTANYTLVLGDIGKLLLMDSSSAREFTIPTNSSVAWPANAGLDLARIGTGAVTIKGATGVSINGVSAGTVSLPQRYSGATAIKISTDAWYIPNATAS